MKLKILAVGLGIAAAQGAFAQTSGGTTPPGILVTPPGVTDPSAGSSSTGCDRLSGAGRESCIDDLRRSAPGPNLGSPSRRDAPQSGVGSGRLGGPDPLSRQSPGATEPLVAPQGLGSPSRPGSSTGYSTGSRGSGAIGSPSSSVGSSTPSFGVAPGPGTSGLGAGGTSGTGSVGSYGFTSGGASGSAGASGRAGGNISR